MERFIARQNIEHYRQLLQTERDPAVRAQIERLLAEAEAAEQALEPDPPAPAPPHAPAARPR